MRRFSPALVLDGEKKQLLAQLSNMEAERAQLRTYLQVTNAYDLQDIVDLFSKLKISIRNLCLTNSNNILKAIKFKSSWITKNASNLMQLQTELVDTAGLAISEKDARAPLKNSFPMHSAYHQFHTRSLSLPVILLSRI